MLCKRICQSGLDDKHRDWAAACTMQSFTEPSRDRARWQLDERGASGQSK